MAQAARAEPTTYRSLGLDALMQQVQEDQVYSILDLGPAIRDNVEFWSRYRCRLHFADFFRTLTRSVPDPLAEEPPFESVLQSVLSIEAGTRFEIIMTWDLLNYFDPAEIEVLVQYLSRHCGSGTLLLAMVSSKPEIPAEPMTYRIVDRSHLQYERHGAASRPCPRYQARDISKLMVGFAVSGSYLLRHGIQEHLFVAGSSIRAG